MQFIIPATFVDSDGFKTGLSPAITIRQRDEQHQLYIDVVSDVMEDKGLGDYVYTFIEYDKSKLYTYKIDGGDDGLTTRRLVGNNELDYFSNKEDWGTQIRGAIGGYSNKIYDRIDQLEKLLDILKPKDIDLTEILTILKEIQNKEYPKLDNEEILEVLDNKLSDKSDKMEIISTIKSNEANLLKNNEQNKELITNLLEQIKTDSKVIDELKRYIEKLIRRGDINSDPDFRRIVKKIQKEKEINNIIKDIELQLLIEDDDFKSLLKRGQQVD